MNTYAAFLEASIAVRTTAFSLLSSITDAVFKVRFVGGITLEDDASFMWVVLV